MIDDALKTSFDRIRATRRQCLHIWYKDYDKLSVDAVACYRDALNIVAFVLGQTIQDGKLVLDLKLTKYLRAQGVFTASETEQ